VLAASPRKLVERTEHQTIVLVNVGEPPLTVEVGVKLWLAGIQIAAGVIEGLGPGERAEELETAIEAALIFGLERVINRIAAVVLDRDGTERVEAVVGGVGIWNAIKILVSIVIPGEVFSAVTDIGEAGGAVRIQLALNLQIPLADVRCDVGRKKGLVRSRAVKFPLGSGAVACVASSWLAVQFGWQARAPVNVMRKPWL